jgi:hypothetical protein
MFLNIIHCPVFIYNTVLFIFQNNVSETGFCLYRLDPTELVLPEDGDRIQSPQLYYVPSSQAFRSYEHIMLNFKYF